MLYSGNIDVIDIVSVITYAYLYSQMSIITGAIDLYAHTSHVKWSNAFKSKSEYSYIIILSKATCIHLHCISACIPWASNPKLWHC